MVLKDVLEHACDGACMGDEGGSSRQRMEIHQIEEFHELRARIARLNGKAFDPIQKHGLVTMPEISLGRG